MLSGKHTGSGKAVEKNEIPKMETERDGRKSEAKRDTERDN